MTSKSGGQRSMWLRKHREEIVEYFEQYGKEATMREYGIARESTLEHVLNYNPGELKRFTSSQADRNEILAQQALAGVADLKKKVEELRGDFERFQKSVGDQLRDKFFLPLLQAQIQLPAELDGKSKPDPLSLDGFPQPEQPKGVLKEVAEIASAMDKPECMEAETWQTVPIEARQAYSDCQQADRQLFCRFKEAVDANDWRQALVLHITSDQQPCFPFSSLRLDDNWDETELARYRQEAEDWISESQAI